MIDYSDMSLELETFDLLEVARRLMDRPGDDGHIHSVSVEMAHNISEIIGLGTIAPVVVDLLHIISRLERELTDCELKGLL